MFSMRTFPTAALGDLRRQVDQVVQDVFQNMRLDGFGRAEFPALTLWADAENLYAEAELPGMKIEDIAIEVVGDELSLKGNRKPVVAEGVVYHRQERGFGQFARIVTLPAPIDAERVEATLKDGILRLVLPKAAAARARKIEVKRA